MLGEVRSSGQALNSPSSALQTQERVAYSTSYVRVSPSCDYYTKHLNDISPTAQRDAAIVTSIPGTTRDVLSLSLDIGGIPVIISDTAGLRQTQDVVENIGIERANKA